MNFLLPIFKFDATCTYCNRTKLFSQICRHEVFHSYRTVGIEQWYLEIGLMKISISRKQSLTILVRIL